MYYSKQETSQPSPEDVRKYVDKFKPNVKADHQEWDKYDKLPSKTEIKKIREERSFQDALDHQPWMPEERKSNTAGKYNQDNDIFVDASSEVQKKPFYAEKSKKTSNENNSNDLPDKQSEKKTQYNVDINRKSHDNLHPKESPRDSNFDQTKIKGPLSEKYLNSRQSNSNIPTKGF